MSVRILQGDCREQLRGLAAESVTSRYVKEAFGVSWATAKRDVQALAEWLPVSVAKIHGVGCAVVHELRMAGAA